MKKTLLAVVALATVFVSVAANAEAGKPAGDAAVLDSTGTLIAGGVAAGAAIEGAISVSKESDAKPTANEGTATTTATGTPAAASSKK